MGRLKPRMTRMGRRHAKNIADDATLWAPWGTVIIVLCVLKNPIGHLERG